MKRTQPVMLRNRPEVVVAGVTIDGALPGMVVFINATKDNRKRFARFCHAMNIGWEPVLENPDPLHPNKAREPVPGAYLCVGGYDDLLDLSGKWLVRDWHWLDNNSLSKGSGAGQKVKPTRSEVFDKPEDADDKNAAMRRMERRFELKKK